MTAAAISAQLVDIRNVGQHKCVKLTLHAPEEHAMAIMEAFGWPTMVAPVPVALARLGVTAAGPPRQISNASPAGAKRTFEDMTCAQQAGMLSQDRAFRLFLAQKFDMPIPDPDEAAGVIRHHCKVKSRADIKSDNGEWSGLVLAYRLWQREPEFME